MFTTGPWASRIPSAQGHHGPRLRYELPNPVTTVAKTPMVREEVDKGMGMFRLRIRLVLVAVIAAFGLAGDPGKGSGEPAPTLRQAITVLAETENIALSGLTKIEESRPAPSIDQAGTVRDRIAALLDQFNYVVGTDSAGNVRRIVILGMQNNAPALPRTITVATRKSGHHHLVSAVLVGAAGKRVQSVMMIDTGASHIVAPESMAADLGFAPEDLHPSAVQTANGRTTAHLGTLTALEIGHQWITEVPVAFMPDAQLGGHVLLGMSALNRFTLTLDDARNLLVLTPR